MSTKRSTHCGRYEPILSRRQLLARAGAGFGSLALIDLLAGHLPHRRRLSQYHWGGGTPTYQTPSEMEALHRKVTEHFRIDSDAEATL